MSEKTFEDLFVSELKDVYDAEKRIIRSLPKLIKAAKSKKLSDALSDHLEQTETHVTRLESIFERIGMAPKRKTCKAMVGLIAEAEELLEESSDENVRDAAIIAAAQKVEHYEMATYGTLREWAQVLSHLEVVATLQQTLEEEMAADKALTRISTTLNLGAAHSIPRG